MGIRERLESTDAMLTNSLFLDFLLQNGLNVVKDEYTRDIICLEFGFGSPSYDAEMKKYKAKIKELDEDESLTDEQRSYKKNVYQKFIDRADRHKDEYSEISKQELREKFYVDGVSIPYRTYHKETHEVLKEEIIHYKMLYRTPGKAKKGTCMFINEKLYDKAHNFLYMGIKLPEKNSPIVQMGAYSSLITSTVVGRIKIEPEQILVIKDIDCKFKTNVITVETNAEKHCIVNEIADYEVKNTIFDGQALIDSSIFPEWADGYVLLRNHMTKCAAFCSNIELFMREEFGDEYETAVVQDMWGRDVNVRDIKLITTDSAMKWLTFDVEFDYWAEWVRKNGSVWGIVKTTHESKLGDVQRMSYQMVNSLAIDTMADVTSKSVAYIELLKSDNDVFIDYLRKNTNFSNDYEVLVALAEHNKDFVRSEYFRDRKRKILEAYVLDFKSGRSIQNADNLTIIGSPYAMLLASIGKDVYGDPTFYQEEDAIQCWTARFDDGEYLAAFRSPFNARNNMGYLHNHYHLYMDKYFKFGKLIIAVNLVGTCWQDRQNGADQDSDSCYTTNQSNIVNHAKYCYKEYPTIVNLIPKEKNVYDYTMKDFALVDNKLAAAQLAIGLSSNLAQLCLTYTYNFKDKKYQDYVCILSVLA